MTYRVLQNNRLMNKVTSTKLYENIGLIVRDCSMQAHTT